MITGVLVPNQTFSTDTTSVTITLNMPDGSTQWENLAVVPGSVLQESDAQAALTAYLAAINGQGN